MNLKVKMKSLQSAFHFCSQWHSVLSHQIYILGWLLVTAYQLLFGRGICHLLWWLFFWEREGFAGLGMWSIRVVQSEQHMICRLMASWGQGGPSKHGRNWQRKTAVSGSSPQLTLKKGAPGDQVWDLLCVQLASYLERGPLMWMMPLHLHVNQKSDYDDDDNLSPRTLQFNRTKNGEKCSSWKYSAWQGLNRSSHHSRKL